MQSSVKSATGFASLQIMPNQIISGVKVKNHLQIVVEAIQNGSLGVKFIGVRYAAGT